MPGLTIRINRGDRFRSRVVNHLNEPLVLHWHGVLAPASMDGHPRDAVEMGGSYDIDFMVDQRPSTCWYHSHTDMLTAEQVYRGLAGFFIINDPKEEELGLPTGARDIPMVLADWRSNTAYQLTYRPAMMDTMLGYLGDTGLVNGTPGAWLGVDQGTYRFRLLNGSNARVMNIGFDDRRPFFLVGTDGGLLPEPLEMTAAMIAPGQRLDILVDFEGVPTGQALELKSLSFAPDGGGGMHSGGVRQGDELALLRIFVDRAGAPASPIPQTLVPFESWAAEDSKTTRRFVLSFARMRHYINGAQFEIDRSDFTVPEGELEIWEYRNLTNIFHPMHMHGAHFQLLERVGMKSIAPEDQGWKDTVLVYPDETVRVIVRFEAHSGLFLHHCHNLEHEDAGMMQNFDVEPTSDVSLSVEREGELVVLSWPEEVDGYRLEASENMTRDSWNPVLEPTELVDGRHIVRLLGRGDQFFRLVRNS